MQHVRLIVLGVAILLPSAASGVVIMSLDDPQKERAVGTVLDDPKVKALRTEFDALAGRMLLWKARDFEALFGPPVRPVEKDYALTCTQSRVFCMGGVGLSGDHESKAHQDIFLIGADLRVDVHFQRDGVTPQYMHFYLRAGDGFVRLDRADQLDARVTWERAVLWKTLRHVGERWRAVVGWEVDRAELDKLYTGREDINPHAKFQGYLDWGKGQGLHLEERGSDWQWYRGEVRVAHAYGNGTGEAHTFVRFDADGRSVRDDSAGGPRNYAIRWNRREGEGTRFESWERAEEGGPWRPVGWGWSDGRSRRSEKDTNGDGIPDELVESAGDKVAPAVPLSVEHSWAVHPELIPPGMRVADHPGRRLPIRRIAQP